MKKKLKLLLLPFLLLGVTACGNPENELKEAISKTEKATSYHIEYKIEMNMTTLDTKLEIPITMNMDVDTKNEVAYAETTISAFDIEMKSIGYADLKTNTMYTQNLETEKWEKETFKEQILPNINLEYSDIKKIKGTDTEDVYEVTIKKEDYKKNISLLQSTANDSIILEKDIHSKIYVNKKTNYITKIETDITDSISANSENLEYTKLKITNIYSKFNDITVDSIEQEIIDKAVVKN